MNEKSKIKFVKDHKKGIIKLVMECLLHLSHHEINQTWKITVNYKQVAEVKAWAKKKISQLVPSVPWSMRAFWIGFCQPRHSKICELKRN